MMTKRQAANSVSDWMWIVALIIFASGALCGFALTALPKLAPHNWIYWVGGRIIWQLGGAVWFGAAVCDVLAAQEFRWKGAALGALLGFALCFNPVLDIIRGPQLYEGQVTHVEIWNNKLSRAKGAYSPTIRARVNIETEESEHQLKLRGRQVNLWGEVFDRCYESDGMMRAVILRHLNVVLSADCSANNLEGKD